MWKMQPICGAEDAWSACLIYWRASLEADSRRRLGRGNPPEAAEAAALAQSRGMLAEMAPIDVISSNPSFRK
jgi:hypothetical protein